MKKNFFFFALSVMALFSIVSCGDDDDIAPSSEMGDDMYGKGEKQYVDVSGKQDGYEYVDLGLSSGLKWATCNVGATSPCGIGNYYAWSELLPKDSYLKENWRWIINVNEEPLKYASDWEDHRLENGNVILDVADDVVATEWGGNWRMPTENDQKELFNGCFWKWVEDYKGSGVSGMLGVSMINEHVIFFPAGGYKNDKHNQYGIVGAYWSSSERGLSSEWVNAFRFVEDLVRVDYLFYKYDGLLVRGVCK